MGLFDTFGKTSVLRGASYVNDYNKDVENAIRMNQLRMERAQQREQKARYYSERLKEGMANDELNSKRLESYYNILNKELGDFVMNAPENWEQNILYQKQFNEIADKYLNNPILVESQRVKAELAKIDADENITPEFKEMNMQRYEEYKNQFFDPNDPLAELDNKFSYSMKPTVRLDEAVANVAKTIGLAEYDFADNKYIWRVKQATPDQIDSAVSMLLYEDAYRYSLDMAWNKYEKERSAGKALDIYKDRNEFARALVQNSTSMQKTMRDVDPTYEYKLKLALANSKGAAGRISVPSKASNMIAQLDQYGEYAANDDILAYANISPNGIITWGGDKGNAGKAIAYLNGLGEVQSSGLSSINSMVVEKGRKRIFVDPATGGYLIETSVIIPATNEDYNKLVKTGKFREVDPMSTEYGREKTKEGFTSFDKEKKYLRGIAYLPANLSDPNNHWEYMDWGFDQKSRDEFMQTGHVEAVSQESQRVYNKWAKPTQKQENGYTLDPETEDEINFLTGSSNNKE
jgi:hypothetical protein